MYFVYTSAFVLWTNINILENATEMSTSILNILSDGFHLLNQKNKSFFQKECNMLNSTLMPQMNESLYFHLIKLLCSLTLPCDTLLNTGMSALALYSKLKPMLLQKKTR